MNAAIRLRNVGRFFASRSHSGSPSPREAMRSVLEMFGLGRIPIGPDGPRDEQIEATFAAGGHVLKALDLEIEAGTVVCIAGASGSGKTTLLRMLARALPPTEGRIELAAPVSALLDVGDNLEPASTGRENIENQRRLKRIDRAAAEAYARDVIAFAGLEGFEDLPVERYSTGMRMRLSVALAMEGDPPILVIDDVLGVGDIAFQQACVDRLLQLRAAGSTIVFVSEDDALIARLASRVVTLSGGSIVSDGAPQAGDHVLGGVAGLSWEIADLLPENDVIALRKVTVDSAATEDGVTLDVTIELLAKHAAQRCRPLLDVVVDKVVVMRSLYPEYCDISAPGPLRFTVRVPAYMLSARNYRLDVHLVSLVGRQVSAMKATGIVWLDVKREGSKSVDCLLVTPLAWEAGPMDNYPSLSRPS